MNDVANQLQFEATLSRLLQQLPWCTDILAPIVPPSHVSSEATQPLNPGQSPSDGSDTAALARVVSVGGLE